MKKLIVITLTGLLLFASTTDCLARGGFSSGGSRGGFSSSRSYGGGSRSYGGGIGGGRSYSSSRSYSRTYNTTRVYHTYRGGYVHPYMLYGGWGMGYGYSNGLLTGLIIGDMMHPQGTVIYNGGGYGGQALLYPNGAVVDATGHQVGTYINGQFIAVQNGPMLAQSVPIDAVQQPIIQQQKVDSSSPVLDALETAVGIVICLILLIILVSLFIGA